ncbi:DUF779 domain-containing protein [Lysinibacillus sp. OL1_EC]|uniref:DUF779 domain-containing protein n=1 Tax=unclassified Lysinibacillus TaxID=2636778 RepID=UPI00103D7091|nr:DUF779 domain-containing protein [Lysinibacillus sp. OL1]MCM0625856.1 DUF779 domain-containing protein [Lysinibacillus sp. OL1_EC]TBV86268.1 DUF779 domain-containing protein [Lysinibacillus sp. OL1]
MVERVLATEEALALIDLLKGKHGPVMFHQSGGCCDGSSPMCYPEGDLLIGDQDVCLGVVGGALFYMHKNQYDYWKHTQIILDVVDGRGGMFSLEGVEGKRFLTRSRAFKSEELQELGLI